MNIPGLKNICTPAYVYLVISIVALVLMAFQNVGNDGLYCIGSHSCNTTSVLMIFVLKLLYIVFWTWVLNIICRGGASGLAWFFVLLPYILMFIFIGMLFIR
jgi:hypothetical protein